MAIYNTTNVVDNSIFLKAKLAHNMVGDNYYIENLQEKRDRDWEFRANVIDIEEELNKQLEYTTADPIFSPIDVAINPIKDEKGKDMGDDWASISFKNLKYDSGLGKRYRFFKDFTSMSGMSESDKKLGTSIWICVNRSGISAGNSCVIRRCNSFVGFTGAENRDREKITEFHYEPCILENERKYMQIYNNQTIAVPQAEWYITFQLNYFTNFIEINDRFLLGYVDTENRSNNQAYKVKAVIKSMADKTFIGDDENELEFIPLITVAVDKDTISESDDLENRIANVAPVYKVPAPTPEPPTPVGEYTICLKRPFETDILLGTTESYEVELYRNNVKVSNIDFFETASINGVSPQQVPNYCQITKTGKATFTIKNLKAHQSSPMILTYYCFDPQNDRITISGTQEINLIGFY